MSIRLVGVFSLVLNVALVAAWLDFRSSKSGAMRPDLPPPILQARKPEKSPPTTPASTASRSPASEAATTLPWLQIESADFPAFIQNLREVGCPERTIRDIVAHEIERIYESRRSNPSRVNSFWWTEAEQYAESRRREIAEARFELEQRSVLKALLGVEGNWPKAAGNPLDWAIYCWGAAIPDIETVEKACWVLDSAKFQHSYFRTESGKPLTLSELARLKEMRDQTLLQLEAIIGPQRSTELLQLASLNLLMPEASTSGVGATGITSDDLRRISSVLPRDLTVLNYILDHPELAKFERFIAGLPPKPTPDEQMEALAPLVTKALGPRRAAQLTRIFDGYWSDSVEFTRSQELPQRIAEVLSDVKHIAFEESKRLRDAAELEPDDEEEQLQAVSQSTVSALRQLLPDKAFNEYLREHGQWITNMAKGLKP